MNSLSEREKRTVRLAVIGIGLYLALFFCLRGWKRLEAVRTDYGQRLIEAQRLRRDVVAQENRVLLAQKLKETFRFDPQKLSRATLVAEASAAIQKAATGGGLQLGPMRESPARSSAKELTSMQLEGTGAVPAVMMFLHKLETLGYPLVVDGLQLTPDTKQQGKVKVNLTVILLDFEQWKREEAPRA